MMMKLRGILSAFAGALLVGGCSLASLGSSPPATYDLRAPAVSKARSGRDMQITINAPTAVKIIDTEEVLVKSAQGRVAYFSGVAWGDRLPRLFQARLAETFANSGAFRAVLTGNDRVTGDMSLSIEIRDFQVESSPSGGEAIIDVYIKLINERENLVATTRRFTEKVPVAGDSPAAGVEALNVAFERVALAIVSWVSKGRVQT